jgi:hypothetical protein
MLQLTTNYPSYNQIRWDVPDVVSNPEPSFSCQHLRETIYNIKTWAKKAEEDHIDISTQLNKIKYIVDNMPEITHPENSFPTEVVLIYQNKMHRYYLCEIVRDYTLKIIEKFKTEGLKKFNASYKSTKNEQRKNCVLQSHLWLLRRLPEPVTILREPREYDILTIEMIDSCNSLLFKIDEMRKTLGMD